VKLKLDENLPSELLDHLRSAGHDVMSVGEERLAGAADEVVSLGWWERADGVISCRGASRVHAARSRARSAGGM